MFEWIVEEGKGIDTLQARLNILSSEYAMVDIKLRDNKDWTIIGKRIQ